MERITFRSSLFLRFIFECVFVSSTYSCMQVYVYETGGIRFPRAGVKDSCELPYVDAGI